MATTKDFGFAGFGLRLLFALLLVLATYNPSGLSWLHWLNDDAGLVYKVGLGVLLLIGWVIYLRATWNSLGAFGTCLALVLCGVLVWLAIEWGWLSLSDTSAMVWVLLLVVSMVLALGMSWSHVRRRMSGQYDTDEIEG